MANIILGIVIIAFGIAAAVGIVYFVSSPGISDDDLCGDGYCASDESTSCPSDCKIPTCNNRICEPKETSATCSTDCTPSDDHRCGDNVCDFDETHTTCPSDCDTPYWCGDGYCDYEESPVSCSADCGNPSTCGNGVCAGSETSQNCPSDCGTGCSDSCSQGAIRCYGQDSRQFCVINENGCRVWSSSTINCPSGTYCDNAVCKTSSGGGGSGTGVNTPAWLASYTTARRAAGVADVYTECTANFDCASLAHHVNAILAVPALSSTAEQYAKAAAMHVHLLVDYDLLVKNLTSDGGLVPAGSTWFHTCQEMTSHEVLEYGRGICSTDSLAVIGMMRATGLAARVAVGCARWSEGSCNLLSIVKPTWAQNTPPFKEGNRYIPAAGGLHAWVEVWLPTRGWVIMEATSASMYSTTCIEYQRNFYMTGWDEIPQGSACGVYDSVAQFCEET